MCFNIIYVLGDAHVALFGDIDVASWCARWVRRAEIGLALSLGSPAKVAFERTAPRNAVPTIS